MLGLAALIWLAEGADSTRVLLTRLILVAMAAIGALALRRRILTDHPDATMAGLRDRARRRVATLRRPRAAEPAPEDRRLERLERLSALHERGALSDEEFAAEKSNLLSAGGS